MHEKDVLRPLARTQGCEPDALWIEAGIVWHRLPDGSLRTVCQTGMPYWQEHEAAERAWQVIDRLRRMR